MTLSKKQIEHLKDYGKVKSVKELAAELETSKQEIRLALKQLEVTGGLRDKPAPEPFIPDSEKISLDRNDYKYALLTALVAMVVYLLTCGPEITGEDSGELITAAYTLGICHPPGYPIWCILGKIFSIIIPFGSVAFRINLMSGIFAAGTVFFLFLIIRKLTGNRIIAASASLIFAFTYELWEQSVIAEVYTLNTLFLTSSLFLLYIWLEKRDSKYLYILALITGLGCTNHHTMAPIAGLIAVFVILKGGPKVLKLKVAGISLLIFIASLSVYFYIPLRASANPYMNWGKPDTISKAVDHVMRRQYEKAEDKKPVKEEAKEESRFWGQVGVYAGLYIKQFKWFLFWLPMIGLLLHFHRKRLEFLFFLALFLATSLGFIIFTDFKLEREPIIGIKFLFIPSYLVATIWASIAMLGIWKLFQKKFPKENVAYILAGIALCLPLINLISNYTDNDRSDYYYSYDLGKSMFDTMDRNAIIFPSGDHNTFPLFYFQGVMGMRKDVTIANKYGDIEKELYQGLIDKYVTEGKDPKTITSNDEKKYIIVQNQHRPTYFTIKPTMTEMRGLSAIPEGLLYRIVRNVDLPRFRKKTTDKFWKTYTLRNLNDDESTRDYSADVIMSDYHFARARSYFEEGKTDEGLAEVKKMKKSAEGFKETFNNIGNMLAERGLFKKAIPLYEKALSYNPDYMMAIRNLAKVYRQLKDYPNAEKFLKKIMKSNPNDFNTHMEFAQILCDKKLFDRAIAKYKGIIKMFPNHYLPYRNLGFIYLNEKKDREKALEYFRKSVEHNNDQPYLKGILAGKSDKKDKPKPPENDNQLDKKPDIENPKPDIPNPKIPDPRPKIPKPTIPIPVIPRPGPKIPRPPG